MGLFYSKYNRANKTACLAVWKLVILFLMEIVRTKTKIASEMSCKIYAFVISAMLVFFHAFQ